MVTWENRHIIGRVEPVARKAVSKVAPPKKTWREVTGMCQYPVGGKFHSAHHCGDLDIVDLFNEGRLL